MNTVLSNAIIYKLYRPLHDGNLIKFMTIITSLSVQRLKSNKYKNSFVTLKMSHTELMTTLKTGSFSLLHHHKPALQNGLMTLFDVFKKYIPSGGIQ